jgi:hypothetical protein
VPLQLSKAKISLIRKYRRRLSADVLTGKSDIRHLAPADQAEADAAIAQVLDHADESPDADEVDDNELVGRTLKADD